MTQLFSSVFMTTVSGVAGVHATPVALIK